MPLESLTEVLKDSSRPVFLFGSTPPREGTSLESAKQSAKKFAERSAVLATDGFIIYDIQDEEGRTTLERPFPFRRTIDSAIYASFFPLVSGKQCVVYKCVADQTKEQYCEWLHQAADIYGHVSYNLVGAASSSVSSNGISLSQAASLMKSKSNCFFGCVAIPERHTAKGNETINMLRKIDLGAEWFITQGIFASEPVIKLICQYGDLCREKDMIPKKVVLTFAPCGRSKTMQFIKWLGMFVPENAEKRIFDAVNPVKESLLLLKELLAEILEKTAGSGVPLGVNVESLSIFREEIDAAHELFQILQSTLLNHRGSPWAVRWFDLKKKLVFTATHASPESLQQLQQIYASIEGMPPIGELTSRPITPTQSKSSNNSNNNNNDSNNNNNSSSNHVIDANQSMLENRNISNNSNNDENSKNNNIIVTTTIVTAVLSGLIGFIIGRIQIKN